MNLFFNHLHVNKLEVFLEYLGTPATVTAASRVGRLRHMMTLGNEVRKEFHEVNLHPCTCGSFSGHNSNDK